MFIIIKNKIIVVTLLFIVVGTASVESKINYPSKLIKFIVPWAAGGSSDTMALSLPY